MVYSRLVWLVPWRFDHSVWCCTQLVVALVYLVA